jgi:hypothetical protein
VTILETLPKSVTTLASHTSCDKKWIDAENCHEHLVVNHDEKRRIRPKKELKEPFMAEINQKACN